MPGEQGVVGVRVGLLGLEVVIRLVEHGIVYILVLIRGHCCLSSVAVRVDVGITSLVSRKELWHLDASDRHGVKDLECYLCPNAIFVALRNHSNV